MSINYHAYQNRKVLFENHEADAQIWYQEFQDYDPSRIMGILNLKSDSGYLYIPYRGRIYRLSLKEGYFEYRKGEEWSKDILFNEGMVLYHLLKYTVDTPRTSDQWVLSDSLYGKVSRKTNMKDVLLDSFSMEFSEKTEDLRARCEKIGGRELPKGDAGYEFDMFPFLPVQMIFWDKDEDFPAQVQVFVRPETTDYLHISTIGCLIADLFDWIGQAFS